MAGRIARERKTVETMLRMYCGEFHTRGDSLCDSCGELLDFALEKIDKCVYGTNKPACSECPIHCYKPEKRARIREVMRYSGPRMLYTHPVLGILHMADKLRKPPPTPRKKRAGKR